MSVPARALFVAWACVLVATLGPVAAQTCDPPEPLFGDIPVGEGSQADIVWNGTEYGISWVDEGAEGFGLSFRRMGQNGEWLGDPTPIVVPTQENPVACTRSSLAWTGTYWGVAWEQFDFNTERYSVRFQRVEADGSIVEDDYELLANAQGPILIWVDTRFFVTLTPTSSSVVQLMRFASEATRVLRPAADVTNTGVAHSLLWNGSEISVVFGERIRTFNVFLEPLGPSVDFLNAPDYRSIYEPDWRTKKHVWNGSNYLVGMTLCQTGGSDRCPLVFSVLDQDLTPLNFVDTGAPAGDTVRGMDLVWIGDEAIAIWNYEVNEGTWVRRFMPDGRPIGLRERVGAGGGWEGGANIAWNGIDFAATVEPRISQQRSVRVLRVSCNCSNEDGDDFSVCTDCDDMDPEVYPGAPELCDGKANDCFALDWPDVPADEADVDGDGWAACAGDCNDENPAQNPDGIETCNTLDDDCNGLVDEDELGEDSDADLVGNLCDNCREVANPGQENSDLDRLGDACDNCPLDTNPDQRDRDADSEGDLCDVDDGLIYARFPAADSLSWELETGFDTWNVYSGDLAVLRAGGDYAQLPGSNPLASRTCGLATPGVVPPADPDPGSCAFFLVTGSTAKGEGDLGLDGNGALRPNANPCP